MKHGLAISKVGKIQNNILIVLGSSPLTILMHPGYWYNLGMYTVGKDY